MLDINALLGNLERWEGRVPWLYQDTKGHVTIGVGYLVPSAAVAQTMPFVDFSTGAQVPATAAQVASEFARVQALYPGMAAIRYRNVELIGDIPYPPIELTQVGVDQVGAERIAQMRAGLEKLCPGYHGYPEPAQDCLLDIAWQIGVHGLGKFHLLVQAVDECNWTVASQQCHVLDAGDERNAWRAQLFESLAVG